LGDWEEDDVKGSTEITGNQELLLMLNFLLASAFIIIPSIVIGRAKQGGPVALAIATAVGTAVSWLYTSLSLRFQSKTIVECAQTVLGRLFGRIVGILFTWFALHLGALVLRNFVDFIVVGLIPETPPIVTHAVITLLAVLILNGGLGVLCRFSELVAPLVVLSIVLILCLSLTIKDIDFQRLRPLLGDGWAATVGTAMIPVTFPFGETVLFTMIMPYISRPDDAVRIHTTAVILAGIILTMTTVVVLAAFGTTAGGHLYAAYTLTRCISVAAVMERVESVAILDWILSGLVKLAVCLHAFVSGSAAVLNIRESRPLLFPSGVIMAALSLLVYDDIIEQVSFATEVWPLYSPVFEVGIPLFLLIVSVIRGVPRR